MRWPYWYPTRTDIVAILLALILVGLCAFASVHYPLVRRPPGFGADWDCQTMLKGGPICIKKADHT